MSQNLLPNRVNKRSFEVLSMVFEYFGRKWNQRINSLPNNPDFEQPLGKSPLNNIAGKEEIAGDQHSFLSHNFFQHIKIRNYHFRKI